MYEQTSDSAPPLSERIAAADAAEHEFYEQLSTGIATGFAAHRVDAHLPEWHRVETDPSTTDSEWLRTLVTATTPLPSGMPLAVVFTAESRARLERVLATCEFAEREAKFSTPELLTRALQRTILETVIGLYGSEAR